MNTVELANKLTEERDTALNDLDGMRVIMAEQPPAEAGFSTNFHMIHDKIGQQQFTLRGTRAGDWEYVMDQAGKFVGYMHSKGWRFNAPTPAPPPTPNGAAAIVREEGNGQAADHIETEAARVPEPPAGKVWHTIDSARVVVKPEPDNRVTLEFYETGHKWPDIKANKWKMEQARGLLKHVTSHDPEKAADLSLACRVYYTDGKEKNDKPGEFWKDIAHVRPTK